MKRGKECRLTVKDMCVENENLRGLQKCSWEKDVWKKEIPPKIQIFLWLAVQNCIATKEFLWRRSVIKDPTKTCCFWCGESADHVLVQCIWAWKVWASIYKWWHMDIVMPSSVLQVLESSRFFRSKTIQSCWYILCGQCGRPETRLFKKEVICSATISGEHKKSAKLGGGEY